ncbi:unnamed protein product, partial [Urochloa humidicola]
DEEDGNRCRLDADGERAAAGLPPLPPLVLCFTTSLSPARNGEVLQERRVGVDGAPARGGAAGAVDGYVDQRRAPGAAAAAAAVAQEAGGAGVDRLGPLV